MRWRVLAFAAIFLMLLEIVLRAGVTPRFPDDFRVPQGTLMGYEEFVGQVAKTDSVRIAVVGDSINYGIFAHKSDTLSAYLDRIYRPQHRPVDAYNFSMLAAHPADILPVVSRLTESDAADLIVVNFDYRFYRGEGVARNYPELYERAPEVTPPSGLKVAPRTKTFEARADDWARARWCLYAERDAIVAAVFGERPRKALEFWGRDVRAKVMHRPAFKKKSKLDLKKLKASFDVPPLTPDNPDVRFLLASLDQAKRRGVPVLVYVGPLDRQALVKGAALDEAAYAENIACVKRLVEAHGALFADYSDFLPSAAISDSHHPLATGYRAIAADLAKRLEPVIRELERGRRARPLHATKAAS